MPAESFRKLRQWLTNPGNRVRLGEDVAELVLSCVWFDSLRLVRDSIVHKGARAVVLPQLDRIGFQIDSMNLVGLHLRPVMLTENLVDLELYAALHLGQTIGFLETLAETVLVRHAVPAMTAEMRACHPAFGILKGWITRLSDKLAAA